MRNLIVKNGVSLETRAKAYYNLALIQYISGKFDEAIENFKVAVMLFPDSIVYGNALDEALKAKEKNMTAQNFNLNH